MKKTINYEQSSHVSEQELNIFNTYFQAINVLVGQKWFEGFI